MGFIFIFQVFYFSIWKLKNKTKNEILRIVAICQPYWRMVFLLRCTFHAEQTWNPDVSFLHCTVPTPT